MKQRKQMRVYDLYRFAMVGKTSKIRGIHHYWCNDDVTHASFSFEKDYTYIFCCRDEQDHKNLIRCVNKMAHFIEIEQYDVALTAYNDYKNEYRRRWANET